MMKYFHYLLTPAHWFGPSGIAALAGQHLVYTAIALLIALVIGLPLGLYVGHTRRGIGLVAGIANVLRALPTLGLLAMLIVLVAPLTASDLAYEIPSLVVLVLLAVPPILTATYTGILAVDVAAVDAARGMGCRPGEILLGVELPCALPLIFSGVRSATLQVISTATIAAYVSLGGLGRLIVDGRAQGDYGQMVAGAIVVCGLVLVVDLAIGLASRLCVSKGLGGLPA
jgi:osmoprotectant transport system permease protein